MRPAVVLAILAGSFVILCGLYDAATPYRQAGWIPSQGILPETSQPAPDIGAPDERQHANYVARLLDGEGFPVLDPQDPNLGENYQAHQPPLYYFLAVGWSQLTGADPEEASGSRIRWLNTLIGLATMVGLFFCGRWGLGRDDVGLGMAAFALTPMSIALHSAISNDPLLFAVCTWGLATLVLAARSGWALKPTLAFALVAGVGLYTKTTAIALLPVAFVALTVGKAKLKSWLICLALPIFIATPWLARNVQLYGDPFAISAFNEAFVGAMTRERAIEAIGSAAGYWTQAVAPLTARSTVGVFGYVDVPLTEPVYWLAWIFAALLTVGWVLAVRSESDASNRTTHVAAGALLVVVLGLFIQFNLTYFQGQGRYLYPALPAAALGLAFGATRLLGERKNWTWAVVGGFWSLLSLAGLRAIQDGFPVRLVE